MTSLQGKSGTQGQFPHTCENCLIANACNRTVAGCDQLETGGVHVLVLNNITIPVEGGGGDCHCAATHTTQVPPLALLPMPTHIWLPAVTLHAGCATDVHFTVKGKDVTVWQDD